MLYSGIDLIEIDRFAAAAARWGERFLARVFTDAERDACGERMPSLAARFAAKEAVAKLLGVGLRGLGAGERAAGALGWREIEVLGDAAGRPILVLHGRAQARATALALGPIALSLSHTRLQAVALAVAEEVSVKN